MVNTLVQLLVFIFTMSIILICINAYLFIVKACRSIYANNKYDLNKVITVTLFNIIGLMYFKYVEDKVYQTKNYQVLLRPLFKKPYIKRMITLWGQKNTTFELDPNKDLIKVENLQFSYQTKHNWFKHCLDHLKQYWTHEKYLEEHHFFSFSSLFGHKTEQVILKDLNFSIKPNTINILIGPNGCGKSTLLKILLSLNKNYKGQVLWSGKDLQEIHSREISKSAVYVPQEINIPDALNMYDFLSFSRLVHATNKSLSPQDHLAILHAIKDSGCFEFEPSNILDLSGGQKQKVILASIIAKESPIIFLDEPTTFFDLKNQINFLNFLKKLHQEENKTIIMILHDLEQAINYATNLIVLKEGQIFAQGHPKEIITKELLFDVFNIECEIDKSKEEIELTNITVRCS